MGGFRILALALGAVGVLIRVASVLILTAVGWLVGDMVKAGQLPPAPLGLAAMGLPARVFGIPSAYAGGILVLDALLLFGASGGRSHADDGALGHGGGFGDGGDGGGGGGDE